MKHSQDIGKRERVERAARRSERKQKDRDRLARLHELNMRRPVSQGGIGGF